MADKWQENVPKIEKIEKIDAGTKVPEEQPLGALEDAQFHQTLAKADPTQVERARTSLEVKEVATDSDARPSPINELSQTETKIERLKPASVEEVVHQAEELRKGLQQPVTQLKSLQEAKQELRLPAGQEVALTDTLIHVDSSLKTSLGKVGVEVTGAEIPATSGQKTLVKFLSYLTSADQKLGTLITELNNMDKTKLAPHVLLALQVKVGFIQTEIEFFTNVINKAMESTKTIMNVQV